MHCTPSFYTLLGLPESGFGLLQYIPRSVNGEVTQVLRSGKTVMFPVEDIEGDPTHCVWQDIRTIPPAQTGILSRIPEANIGL